MATLSGTLRRTIVQQALFAGLGHAAEEEKHQEEDVQTHKRKMGDAAANEDVDLSQGRLTDIQDGFAFDKLKTLLKHDRERMEALTEATLPKAGELEPSAWETSTLEATLDNKILHRQKMYEEWKALRRRQGEKLPPASFSSKPMRRLRTGDDDKNPADVDLLKTSRSVSVQVNTTQDRVEELLLQLWLAKEYRNKVEFVNQALRRENHMWRARFREASRQTVHLQRAKDTIGMLEEEVEGQQQQTTNVRAVAETNGAKLRAAAERIEDLETEIRRLKRSNDEARSKAQKEREALEDELDATARKLARSEEVAKRSQRDFRQLQKRVGAVKEALRADDQALQDKYGSVRKHRETTPQPLHLLSS
ncbi:Uncharacterized protein SCF082_LOCUS17656 [Durusdinium trenchii]|uniref:Uncharacterized protein n=1 Tax=Durusdinium trenchii TaxID=1381693 RepID=A0ABP0KJG1_9DINO